MEFAKICVVVFLFLFVGIVLAETTIRAKGTLICCTNGLTFMIENANENSPLKPGSQSNQLIIPKSQGFLPTNYLEQRGCYSMADNIIQLWEKDTFDPDDYIADTRTEFDGGFAIEGSESWDPYVRFYLKALTRCNLSDEQIKKHCTRETIFDIDRKYNDGVFDFQWTIGGSKDEEIKCPR